VADGDTTQNAIAAASDAAPIRCGAPVLVIPAKAGIHLAFHAENGFRLSPE
jgi:hypothetical protein